MRRALALGVFAEFLGLAGTGDALSALVGADRVAGGAWDVGGGDPGALRLARSALPGVLALGLLDTSANGLFVLAADAYLSIVAVLGSLYPVATISPPTCSCASASARCSSSGVALALVGIALVAAG